MKAYFALAIVAGLTLSGTAHAVPMLEMKISDGTNTTIIVDTLNTGTVSFNGAVGSFIVNVSTGIDEQQLGVTNHPAIDLSSVHVSSSSGGTLSIWLTQIGLSYSETPYFHSLIGGTANGSNVFLTTYQDLTDTAFGTGSGPLVSAAFGTGAFANDTWATGYASDYTFSMTEKLVITASGPSAASYDAELHLVPEPASIALMGASLIGLGVVRTRNKKS